MKSYLSAAIGFVTALVALPGACQAALKAITVDANGGGDFRTVQEAIASVPYNATSETVIHIKPGTYQGQIIVPAGKDHITFIGDDAQTTVLTYALNVNDTPTADVPTMYKGDGVVIDGNDIHVKNITFMNTSGDHGQAMALRVDGDRETFDNCRMLGWQDTLLLNSGRQYLRDCYIEGRVDFIYGAATAWFEKCEIHSKNGGHVTAASTPQDHRYGFVFHDCRLTSDPQPWVGPDGKPVNVTTKTPQADLGRPWRPYASVTYIDCTLGDHIKPDGWNNWRNPDNEKTARYAEYDSKGPGASPTTRAAWSHQLSKDQAEQITVKSVLGGNGGWDPASH